MSDATFYDCINTIYQFIKFFLDNKMSIFEEYGAFKRIGCSWYFSSFSTREKTFVVTSFLKTRPSEERTALKGKNLLAVGANSFL